MDHPIWAFSSFGSFPLPRGCCTRGRWDAVDAHKPSQGLTFWAEANCRGAARGQSRAKLGPEEHGHGRKMASRGLKQVTTASEMMKCNKVHRFSRPISDACFQWTIFVSFFFFNFFSCHLRQKWKKKMFHSKLMLIFISECKRRDRSHATIASDPSNQWRFTNRFWGQMLEQLLKRHGKNNLQSQKKRKKD